MKQEQVMNIIHHVRKTNPLIHHITNQVVMNFTANGLLAFGGSPIMAKEFEEMSAISSKADGLLINIGTMLKSELKSMKEAGKTANKEQVPVVLDPVGVAASSFRSSAVHQLLNAISFTAIKGNAGEMAHLVNIPWQTKGVEATDDTVEKLAKIAQSVSQKYQTIAVITGEKDVICFNNDILVNETGHHYLTKITGAGCLLGSLITACLTVDLQVKLIEKVWAAVHFYGKVAERVIAEQNINGPGTFTPHFIDGLAAHM